MTKTKFLVAGGLAAFVGLAGLAPIGASADDADLRAVNNRLDRVERAVNDMQQNYSGGDAPVRSSGGGVSSDMQSRLTEIEDQMRSLTGRIEELSHRVDQTTQDLQSYKQATDLRFQDMQSGAAPAAPGAPAALAPTNGASAASGGASSAAAAPAAKPAAPTVALPAGTAQVQYDFAIDLLKRGQFPQARDAFTQFLQQHPKDQLAGNAQYWLGETYYVQGQYKDAADSFLKGYTTYSKSSKAPDSLLKLGMTLSALGQKDAACATFGQLKEQFPQASPAVVARNKQERQKAGC
ncbi:MAG: tol-pal system protein YbgF [Parvibaculum sp.]|uniref:tol-pal system protein YbgF n=1 Tax=Parvibaculum sp. TaxID=2024848 RepID=UPI0025D33C95|nr:tol-pal system protein YbgF [Parvibaculum sp.]MCE9651243.1 tol-pal system protein YbgF [Parvibaculum sp.]